MVEQESCRRTLNLSGTFPCMARAEERGFLHSLLRTLNRAFITMVRVNLFEKTAFVLQNLDFTGDIAREVDWEDYVKEYSTQTEESLDGLSAERLLNRYQSGEEFFTREISYMAGGTLEWATVDGALELEEGVPYATILVRKSSYEHLQKRIIDLFVYDTCDYFSCIDAKNRSYTIFNGNRDGLPLPPGLCGNYDTDIQRYVCDYVVPEDRERAMKEMNLEWVLDQLEHQETHSFTCGVIDSDRGYTRKRMIYRYYNRESQMLLMARNDITDLYLEEQSKQNELQATRELARTDPLTGLFNLRGTIDEVSSSLEEAAKRSALLFIDLDNFKNVNDTLGHDVGNKLLCQVAETIRMNIRSGDLVGRIGGDEFLVYFHTVTSEEGIHQRAQQLCDAIRQISDIFEIPISSSIGIAISPDDGTDYTTLMKHADARAYQAKADGKNQVAGT